MPSTLLLAAFSSALAGKFFARALSKAWEDPGSVENVITCPCDAAIHGAAVGLLANTNWIEYVTHIDYDKRGRWQPLPGEKAVFFNPHTDRVHIDRFLARLHG